MVIQNIDLCWPGQITLLRTSWPNGGALGGFQLLIPSRMTPLHLQGQTVCHLEVVSSPDRRKLVLAMIGLYISSISLNLSFSIHLPHTLHSPECIDLALLWCLQTCQALSCLRAFITLLPLPKIFFFMLLAHSELCLNVNSWEKLSVAAISKYSPSHLPDLGCPSDFSS